MTTLFDQVLMLMLISLCAAAVSFTITTTSMFKWLRELISPIHKKIEELIHCPWCLGHWIVFIILFCSNINPLSITQWEIFNWPFTAFVIICPMGLIHYVLLRAYEPVHQLMMNRELEKLNKE